MRWSRILILVVVLAVIFGGVFAFIQYKNKMIGQFLASRAHPVIAVTAERVQPETWTGELPAVGTLRAVNGVDVTPQVSGVVKSIDFKSGEMVKKGDTLVQLDVDIETANRNNALAQLKLLQDQLERTSKLPVGTAVTEQTLNQTRFQVQAQQAAVESLNAQIAEEDHHRALRRTHRHQQYRSWPIPAGGHADCDASGPLLAPGRASASARRACRC